MDFTLDDLYDVTLHFTGGASLVLSFSAFTVDGSPINLSPPPCSMCPTHSPHDLLLFALRSFNPCQFKFYFSRLDGPNPGIQRIV